MAKLPAGELVVQFFVLSSTELPATTSGQPSRLKSPTVHRQILDAGAGEVSHRHGAGAVAENPRFRAEEMSKIGR
jgi:hypothetical protein